MPTDLNIDLFNNLRLELRRGLLIVAVLAQLRHEHYGYTLRKDLAALGIEPVAFAPARKPGIARQ